MRSIRTCSPYCVEVCGGMMFGTFVKCGNIRCEMIMFDWQWKHCMLIKDINKE